MRTAFSLIAICLLLGAEAGPEAIKKEMALLDGEWSMVSGKRDGQALPENLVKGAKRVVKSGETTVTIDGQTVLKAKFTLDPTKKVKTIDYTIAEGANEGKTQLGIYELDGDTLKFCYAQPGKDRPTEFKTAAESGRTMSVWKKDKK